MTDIPKDRAVELVNLYPQQQKLEIRGGYTAHVTNLGDAGPIETLMVWSGPATSRLFAATDGKIYDVTNSGTAGAPAVTGQGSDQWQYVNFGTAGGNFLWCCNGSDAPIHYNGSAWANPSLTGATGSDIIGVTAHKRRLFFVFKDSAKFGFLPVVSIAGAISLFDLASVFSEGGKLSAIGTWTIDGGEGKDDYAVFISSNGEVAVYAGTDPADAANWALIGVYKISPPIGRRCLIKAGGDLLIATIDGVISFAAASKLERADMDKASVTSNIRDAWTAAARRYGRSFGWQMIAFPSRNALIVNVPIAQSVRQEQYVMNVLTGAWCRFDGINANCWAIRDNNLYFGGNGGIVYRAWNYFSDAGAQISWRMRRPFDDMNMPGRIKHMKMVRPVIETEGSLSPAIGIDVDYRVTEPTDTPAYGPGPAARYGAARYGTSRYGGSNITYDNIVGTGAIGRTLSIHMKGASVGVSGQFTGFDVLFEAGGYL
jgi:hypothetical protein